MIIVIFCLVLIGVILIPFLIAGISGAVFFPTEMRVINEALKLVRIDKEHKVIDLGSGDGRFLYEAAKFSNYVLGVEIHPLLVLYTFIRVRLMKLKNVHIAYKDFWGMNLEEFDIIFAFLIPRRMKYFEEKLIKELKPGTKVISYAFKLPNKIPSIKTESGLYVYEY